MRDPQPHSHKEGILIVDDTPGNLRLLFQVLTDKGYKVRAVPDGARALEAAHALPPDLILLDIMMPEMDGYEVCTRLKAQAATRDIPVIFMSALDATQDKVNAFAAGGVDYVTKPFQVAEVLARVETHLALKQRNRELASLNRVSQELAVTLDLQQIMEQLLQETTDAVSAEGASVWLWDEQEGDWLTCQAVSPPDQGQALLGLRLPPGQGIAGWVVENGKSVLVPNVRDDARFFSGVDEQTGFRTVSLLAVPLRVRGKVIGVLEVVNKLAGVFDAENLALVETLAASAAIAIDNAHLVEVQRRYTLELEKRNEELDAFAHTVAHDLKGALGSVVGFAQALEGAHAELSDEELQRYLRTIAQGGRKMSNIVDELLLLASVRKMEEVKVESLDMARVVDEARVRLADVIEQHQARVVLPERWPGALGYGPWLEEVWFNYLSNAIKYGGDQPRVELGFDDSGQWTVDSGQSTPTTEIRFWVRDNGPGLTPEEQGRLFRSFERLDQVRAKGHGLGLSIVRRIVEKLDGEVGVESAVGQGSVFWFTLRRNH
jgi:signal transduction histidine kinase/DNA-binding response OmpR family regulator